MSQRVTSCIKYFKYYVLTFHEEERHYIILGSKLNINEEWNMNVLKSNGYKLTSYFREIML